MWRRRGNPCDPEFPSTSSIRATRASVQSAGLFARATREAALPGSALCRERTGAGGFVHPTRSCSGSASGSIRLRPTSTRWRGILRGSRWQACGRSTARPRDEPRKGVDGQSGWLPSYVVSGFRPGLLTRPPEGGHHVCALILQCSATPPARAQPPFGAPLPPRCPLAR